MRPLKKFTKIFVFMSLPTSTNCKFKSNIKLPVLNLASVLNSLSCCLSLVLWHSSTTAKHKKIRNIGI